MTTVINDLIGPLVVALAIAVSAVYALRHLAPRSSNRLQARLAGRLQSARPHWLQRVGARLMPRTVDGGSCDSGCGSCGGCAPRAPSATDAEQPIEFHRKR